MLLRIQLHSGLKPITHIIMLLHLGPLLHLGSFITFAASTHVSKKRSMG